MNSFRRAIEDLGDLHDARLQKLVWDFQSRTIEFGIADMYANFAGLPEYPGKQPGSIVLRDIGEASFEIAAMAQGQRIFEFSVVELGDEWIATVLLLPEGRITAKFGCAQLNYTGDS